MPPSARGCPRRSRSRRGPRPRAAPSRPPPCSTTDADREGSSGRCRRPPAEAWHRARSASRTPPAPPRARSRARRARATRDSAPSRAPDAPRKNSACVTSGLPAMYAPALTSRSSSCWMASLSFDAISSEDAWNASRDCEASTRATACAPTTDAAIPVATSNTDTAHPALIARGAFRSVADRLSQEGPCCPLSPPYLRHRHRRSTPSVVEEAKCRPTPRRRTSADVPVVDVAEVEGRIEAVVKPSSLPVE